MGQADIAVEGQSEFVLFHEKKAYEVTPTLPLSQPTYTIFKLILNVIWPFVVFQN